LFCRQLKLVNHSGLVYYIYAPYAANYIY